MRNFWGALFSPEDKEIGNVRLMTSRHLHPEREYLSDFFLHQSRFIRTSIGFYRSNIDNITDVCTFLIIMKRKHKSHFEDLSSNSYKLKRKLEPQIISYQQTARTRFGRSNNGVLRIPLQLRRPRTLQDVRHRDDVTSTYPVQRRRVSCGARISAGEIESFPRLFYDPVISNSQHG